jgi:hypothetical protein
MTEFFVDGERSLPPPPHQREASWTAVVLYRFLAVRFAPSFQDFNGRGAWRSDTFSK